MKIQLDCYECIMSQVVRLSRQMSSDLTRSRELADEMLDLFSANRYNFTPPELAWKFHQIFARETGITDPFRQEKVRSTELGLELLKELRERVYASANPFSTALRLAVGGNIIDFGVNPDFDLASAEAKILEVLDQPCDHAAIEELHERMKRADNIIYLLDNCGEAVLDRLLLEQFPEKITVAVRGGAIFNDVTRVEAMESGINLPVIDSGISIPGVSLAYSRKEFVDELNRADLVVSKGQGNFESLEGEFNRPIYFLLRIKCNVISRQLQAPLGSLQVIGRNLD